MIVIVVIIINYKRPAHIRIPLVEPLALQYHKHDLQSLIFFKTTVFYRKTFSLIFTNYEVVKIELTLFMIEKTIGAAIARDGPDKAKN